MGELKAKVGEGGRIAITDSGVSDDLLWNKPRYILAKREMGCRSVGMASPRKLVYTPTQEVGCE
jgi:hypothetical protein